MMNVAVPLHSIQNVDNTPLKKHTVREHYEVVGALQFADA